MFLRTVKAAGGKAVQHEYVRLVETYREDGLANQRIVCNLGRKDLLTAHLDSLIRPLRGERPPRGALRLGAVQATGARDWGPMLVARTLWRDLGLEALLDAQGGRGPVDGRTLADRALVLVANRMCAPTSEHGLARRLETDFVCDRQGRRWMPAWPGEVERRASRLPRVRVELRQLEQWYRTLDQLAARKAALEQDLYLRLRDLFSLKVDLALYDLRSAYFEGPGPHGLRYYDWTYREGRFRFFEHPVNLPREQAYEGTYVIQTDAPVQAHIFVAALAFLLHRAIEKKLKAAGLDLSATEALQVLRSVRVVDFTVGTGERKRSVTRGTHRDAQVLSALPLTDLDPPRRPARPGRSRDDNPLTRPSQFQGRTGRKGKHGLALRA